MTWTPWHFIVMAIFGWMNREQHEVIDYLREENRILREKLGRKRIILNAAQKRRLATAAMKQGKDLLRRCSTLLSPDTLTSSHRWLAARKYDGPSEDFEVGPASFKPKGRQRLRRATTALRPVSRRLQPLRSPCGLSW